MKITILKPQGYCAGVARAINIALKAREEHPDKDVYVLGMLVHNHHVSNLLENNNIQLALIDRDIKITLRRTWNKVGFISMMKVIFALIYGAFGDDEIKEEDIERLKSTDALEGILQDFSKSLPMVRETLIDERDQYLAAKILEAKGEKVVAVIGAGHAKGVKSWLELNKDDIDVSALEVIPPTKLLTKLLGYVIPALAIFLIVYGFFTGGIGAIFLAFLAFANLPLESLVSTRCPASSSNSL